MTKGGKGKTETGGFSGEVTVTYMAVVDSRRGTEAALMKTADHMGKYCDAVSEMLL